jgi:hypothetical protein
LKAVWFDKTEIKEPMKCEICNKVFTEGFIIEPESPEEVKRLQNRFPFVTDKHHFIFVSEDCFYKNFSSNTIMVNSKGVKLIRREGYPIGEI